MKKVIFFAVLMMGFVSQSYSATTVVLGSVTNLPSSPNPTTLYNVNTGNNGGQSYIGLVVSSVSDLIARFCLKDTDIDGGKVYYKLFEASNFISTTTNIPGYGNFTFLNGDLDLNNPIGAWDDTDVPAGASNVFTKTLQAGKEYILLADSNRKSVSTTVGTSPVPVPAAIWLFGSALVGLVGASRRKAAGLVA